jgi:hypothetical protein
MGLEQRKDKRLPVRLQVQWNGNVRGAKNRDITSDVSVGGCYVESLDPVSVGQVLDLGLRLPSTRTLPLRGEVRYHQPNIGFGIKFLGLSRLQRANLEALMHHIGKRTSASGPPLVYV